MHLGLVPMGTPIITEIDSSMVAGWRALGVRSLGGRFPDDLATVDEADCDRVRALLAEQGAALAQLWLFERSLYHPDPARVARDHADLRRALTLARRLECPVLIVGGGSCDPDGAFSPHPANRSEGALDDLIHCARRIAPAAEAAGVALGIEPLALAILGTPRRMRRLFEAVPSPGLGVNLDPVNWMTFETIFTMGEAVEEMFDLLGDRIVAAHAKDGYLERRVLIHLSECLCGTGQMDWRAFVRRFARLDPGLVLALEHTADADVPAALAHLRACAAAEGLTFDE